MAPVVPVDFTGQKESRKSITSQAMGKSRKLSSKRPSTGFVPDYRHAVETIAESEGFVNSARVFTELTGSEESFDRKRKCISLNMDGKDGIGVPVQVLSLAKLSNMERRALKSKLLKELEQVQNLQSRLTSIHAVSPPSDIRSCSDVQNRPFPNGIPSRTEVAQHGKKRGGPARKDSRPTKKGTSDLSGAVKRSGQPITSNTSLWDKCGALLDRLQKHRFHWVFCEPVDVVKLNIPDYFNVIKHPMDLGTVNRKLLSGVYSSLLDFAADVRLTFANAMTYNPPGNDVHIMASTMSKFFEPKWKEIEKLLMAVNVQTAPFKSVTLIDEPNSKTKTVMPNDLRSKPVSDVRPIMTDADKQKLSAELESLGGDLPESIVDFLKEQSSSAEQTADDEIEIDIDALGDSTLLKLRKLIDDYLLEKQKNNGVRDGSQTFNIPAVSSSLLPSCKGNEAADEDVDIVGGNDPPISGFPPVEIEKDAAVRRDGRCSSPSSSNSDSGSSSSDSDSASSSESETEAVKASEPEVIFPGDGADQEINGGELDNGNSSLVDVVGMAEEDDHHAHEEAPVFSDRSGPQEEENGPSERQVSPEKMHRAAILRNRFADTILKAQEKAHEKDEKRDPEKLRREREELEKRLREEKARLQAEAKAAEEARKKAEAKAAADAKKQRELERELARQALQKMEKTVDINENSQFLEDLEVLRSANGGGDSSSSIMATFMEEEDAARSHLDDVSENHHLLGGGGGGFMLQGSSNPLEQLGLFRKDDDDDGEDDDGDDPEMTPPPPPSNGAEEGEVDLSGGA